MSKGKFALGALFGAAAGLIAGILTAPKSGKETRADLKAKANEVKADVANKAKSAAEKTGEVVEDVRGKAEEVANDVKAKASDLKSRTERAVDGAKKGFSDKK